MKPLVVEYPAELPGLLKMTKEQFTAEVRLFAAESIVAACFARWGDYIRASLRIVKIS